MPTYRSKSKVEAFLITDVQVTVHSVDKATATLTLDGSAVVEGVHYGYEGFMGYISNSCGFARPGDYWVRSDKQCRAMSAEKLAEEYELIPNGPMTIAEIARFGNSMSSILRREWTPEDEAKLQEFYAKYDEHLKEKNNA